MARYQLRTSIRLARDGGQWLLRDAALGRSVRLGEVDARVVRALQGGTTLAQLASAAQLDPDEAARRLTGLARLYLLQGPRAQQRIALQAERDAFTATCKQPAGSQPLEFPLGRDPPQHGCVGTGTCCSASFLGPLTSADAVRVGQLAFGRRLRHLAGDDVFERVAFGGREHIGMQRESDDGRCIAQGDDLLCDIHAEHGAAAKPVACRQFPLRFYRSPAGVHVSLLLACDGYDRSRDAAAAWSTREAEIRALLTEDATAVRVAMPFEWSAGVAVAAEAWWQLREALFSLEPVAGPDVLADPHAWLAAVLAAVEAQIQATEDGLREGPDIRWPSRLARMRAGLAAATGLYDPAAVEATCAGLAERAQALQGRGLRSEAQRLHDFAAGVRAQGTGVALDRMAAGASRLTATPAAWRHLNDIVANDLQLQVALGHLDAGLGNLTRRLLLAEAVACHLARAAGRTVVDTADTTRALHVVYRSEPDLTALAGIQAA